LRTPRAIAGIMLSSDAKINEERKGGWGLPHLCVWFIEVILLIMAFFSGNYVQPGPTVENRAESKQLPLHARQRGSIATGVE
jgi:hypothetical protein